MTLDLPALPVAHFRAMTLLSERDVSIRDVAGIVEGDPGLTAAVIRAANSAAYAPMSRIGSANQAIVRIGLQTTQRIVASAAVSRAFQNLYLSGLDPEQLWSHTVAAAILADASAVGDPRRPEAFTTGLLLQVGRLAMATRQPERYRRVIELVGRGLEPLDAETEVYGFDSVEWGVHLTRAWDFPDEVVNGIRDQLAGYGSPLAPFVHRARHIARSLGYSDGVEAPVEAAFDPDSEDGRILGPLGGQNGLRAQIEWYQGALAVAA